MSYIYYDNQADLESHVETFKQNISKVVSDNDIDKWTWSGYGGEGYGIQYSCPVEESLNIEILKLTKNPATIKISVVFYILIFKFNY